MRRPGQQQAKRLERIRKCSDAGTRTGRYSFALITPATAIFPDPQKYIPRRIRRSDEGEHATKPALIRTMLGVGTRKQSEEPKGGTGQRRYRDRSYDALRDQV